MKLNAKKKKNAIGCNTIQNVMQIFVKLIQKANVILNIAI